MEIINIARRKKISHEIYQVHLFFWSKHLLYQKTNIDFSNNVKYVQVIYQEMEKKIII